MKVIKYSTFLLIVLVFFVSDAIAQHKSIMQEESEYYNSLGKNDQYYQSENSKSKTISSVNATNCSLTKMVYGWHPYWQNGLQNNYQWNLLSHLSYFSYEVNEATGNANNTHGFATAQAVTTALSKGTKVTLCVTLFSGFSTFFASSTAQQTLINNLVTMVQARGAHGVNIDFEGMGASYKTPFANFMINLSNAMHTAIPGSETSICLYSVDWNTVFDLPAMKNYVNHFIIMGYDYYYNGSTTAGPNDPLYHFGTTYNYTLSKSISYYLSSGLSSSQLILGLPYYGREYTTSSSIIPSSVTNTANTGSRTFKTIKDNTSGNYATVNKRWDNESFSSYYVFQSAGVWRQCFYDDDFAMRKRFEFTNRRALGGIGIWALGYDDGYDDYWQAIEDNFSTCAITACTDSIFDMGGPLKNHYDKENYTYTIAPTNATRLSMSFSKFDLEANFDSLWLYDGNSTSSTLIGKYTGTNSPGNIQTTGNAITLKFKSDNNTTRPGFKATYSCMIDTVLPVLADTIDPTTSITTSGGIWKINNFNAQFLDSDNQSGVDKSFYQVCDFDSLKWRSNVSRGFTNDDFNYTTIDPSWTDSSGTWLIQNGELKQTDQALSNTNLFASLTQNLSNRYLYHWKAKIDGTGTNKRAGFHFFADDAKLTNRGNSYFAWFREDNDKLEIYKVKNNVFSLVKSSAFIMNKAQWYDFKVMYDRITGSMKVWANNNLLVQYTDSVPLANGNYVSFRSGNCEYTVDDLHIYRSRNSTPQITLGNLSCDIRYQNFSPQIKTGLIRSIIVDSASNLSLIAADTLNIDWTPPNDINQVRDGLNTDLQSSYNVNALQANWDATSDSHSGIKNYFVAVGTFCGDTSIVAWTNVGNILTKSFNGLTLLADTYYVSVIAQNNAGLFSSITCSNGIIIKIDNTPPSTNFVSPNNFISDNFSIQFTDTDFATGSGLHSTMFLVAFKDSLNKIQANGNNGFLCDEFNYNMLSNKYTVVSGSWNTSNGFLQQTNESLNSTNCYTFVDQTKADSYLFEYKMSIGGSGSNRRAGLHFMADQPDSSQRNNSYFVWFRLDNDKVQFYKAINNQLLGGTFVKETAFNFNVLQDYLIRILYNRVSGETKVFIDNQLALSYTDLTPIQNGNFISFRNGNSIYNVDDFKIYKSHLPNSLMNISVGASLQNDIYFQNNSPQLPAGTIFALAFDSLNNISSLVSKKINVDWSPPIKPNSVLDGFQIDLDTTINNSQLNLSWTNSIDQNSGIISYEYSISTKALDSNIVDWTFNNIDTTATVDSLILLADTIYYINVRSKNAVGMLSPISTSDGIIYSPLETGLNLLNKNIIVWPVPFDYTVYFKGISEKIKVFDVLGKEIKIKLTAMGDEVIQIKFDSDLAKGVYYIKSESGMVIPIKTK